MDWMTQSQSLVKSWMDTQMKTWEGWFKTMQDTDTLDPGKMWATSIEAWQSAMKNTLSTQAEGSRIWAESVASLKGAPKETGEWANQVQGMADKLTDLQQQMWDKWFEAVKNADASKLMNEWNVDGSPLMTGWQDMSKKMMEAQSQWVETISPKQTKVKK